MEPGIVERVLKLNELADSIFEMAVNALFAQDYELAERVLEKSQEMEPLENEAVTYILERGLEMEDLVNLRLTLVSIKRVSEYAGDIAEVVLNLTVDKAVSQVP
ncbi:TPA: PhoU domain-containing protein [Candidatus Bathyarchaeota archaeon]|nr:PhoU domain-containing protein [Candidatus Bathyarchaeota archaeon]